MELVKKTDNYTIYKKKSGRHAVQNKDKKYLAEKEKEEILLAEGLIKLSPRKKPAEETPAAAAAEETPAAAEETPAAAEETPADAAEEAPAEEKPKE